MTMSTSWDENLTLETPKIKNEVIGYVCPSHQGGQDLLNAKEDLTVGCLRNLEICVGISQNFSIGAQNLKFSDLDSEHTIQPEIIKCGANLVSDTKVDFLTNLVGRGGCF